MNLKKKLTSIALALTMVLMLALPVLADTWFSYYPTVIIDSSGGARTAVPVITGMEGQALIDSGILSSSGLDSRMRVAGTDIPYMLSTTQIPVYLSSLPAYGQVQTDLYVGYDPDRTDFDIITGTDGYITIDDDDTLELGSDFEIEQSGYVDTTGGADVNLVYKEDAFRTYIDGANSITSEIVASVEERVVANNDDCYRKLTPSVFDAASVIQPGGSFDAANWGFGGGMRFTSVPIPNAVTITSAYLTFTASANDAQTICKTKISAEDIDDAGDFAGDDAASFDARYANHTTAIVPWDAIPLWTTDTEYESPDIKTVIQEIVDRGGWAVNNNIVIFWEDFDDRSGNDAYRQAYSHNDTPVKAPLLTVTYELEVTATGIDSDEYTVKTYGVDNEPYWATGDVLHFTGAADSNINCTAIHDNIAKLWVSLWFKLDNSHTAASPTKYLSGKWLAGTDFLNIEMSNDGHIYWLLQVGGGGIEFLLGSTTGSWNADQWYHILVSLSDNAGGIQRLLIDNVLEDSDTQAAANTPNGGDFIIGDFDDPGDTRGFIGEIQNVIVGTDDLTTDEEDALYAGTAPGDETNYWYIDEGTGLVAYDYGTGGNDGAIDNAPTWETSTFTIGSTGRLCDFYIEVDDGVTDPDRWGTNLKGVGVIGNGNDWILNQNNVMPWMDYYKHTVGGVLHAWYQPNYIVTGTAYDGTADGGSDNDTIIDAELVQADDYWVGALVTITDTGNGAPDGEARVCTAFADATNEITVSPVFSAAVDAGDKYTVDFGTLIDRSYYGLEFDGDSGNITVADDSTIQNIFDGGGTVEFWVNPNSDGEGDTGRFIDKADWLIFASNDTGTEISVRVLYTFSIVTGDWITTTQEIDNNAWTHFVFTYNADAVGNNPIMYFNGVAVTVGGGITESAEPQGIRNTDVGDVLYMGSNAADNATCDGIMDGVLLYTRILEQAEVNANFNAGVGNYTPYSTTNLVGQWHIEEGVGAATADTSGEGNNGVLNNTAWVNGQVPRPAGSSGTNDDRITWGVNDEITLVYGEPVNYTTTTSPASEEGGYTAPEADMPAEWYSTAGNIVNLPLYDMFLGISNETLIPVQTLYVFMITGMCFSFAVAGFVMFNSVMASIVGIGLGLGIGSAMTVVPMWIFFTFLILAIGIAYLKGRSGI